MLPSYRLTSERAGQTKTEEKQEEDKSIHACYCGLQGIFRCSKCKDKHYCSAAHQRSDWKEHKKLCVPTAPPSTRPRADDDDLGEESGAEADPLLPLSLSDALLSSTAAALTALGTRLGELTKESK